MIEFSITWFLDGFTHPLETPSHLMLLLGLALFIGQQGKSYFIPHIALFSIAVVVGFIINHYFAPRWNNELILLSLALFTSLLVIFRFDEQSRIIQTIVACLSIASGILLGLDSSPIIIPGLSAATFYNWLLGAALALNLTLLIIAIISFLIRNLFQGIILRVLSSWIATSALFVLTLFLSNANR
ncbi:MAG: HupE/UreJ family protein [Cocleimonas sp.]|nr:HupE/UreJ family protein [Cocleimonas sp.]